MGQQVHSVRHSIALSATTSRLVASLGALSGLLSRYVLDMIYALLRCGTAWHSFDTRAEDSQELGLLRERGRMGPRVPLPLQVLQLIGMYLEPSDLAAAQLVSQEWREQLSAQVHDIQLPAYLWQYCVPGQLVALYHLLDSFKHVQHVRLRIVPQHPVDSWSMGRTMDALRFALPMLHSVELSHVVHPGHWRAVLLSLQCLRAQLTRIKLHDIYWPPQDMLHLLTAFTSLQRLDIASPHFSRLEPAHLAAIGRLRMLQQLRLCFRTVTGTANCPLVLDPLSSLVQLSQLDVHYTGLLELSSAVMFCRTSALRALSNLQQLSVSLIPMSSLASLAHLPRLHTLQLQQVQPVTMQQCLALAQCQQLAQLTLSSVQWCDVPHLADLTGLTSLSLQLWHPPRGSVASDAADQQLLHLKSLRALKQVQLKGQCELSSDFMTRLASHWQCLTSLDLRCVLPGGTQGLQHFTALRSLKLNPYKWDVWSSEPPTLLYPALLPSSLTELVCTDAWCCDVLPGPRTSGPGCGRAGGAMHHSSSCCSISGILMGISSVGRDLCQLGGALDAGADCSVDVDVDCTDSSTCDQPAFTDSIPDEHEMEQDSCGSLLQLQTPHLRRLVLRSISPFDRHLPMPDLSICSQLEELELQHSQLNQLHVQHIVEVCSNSLRSLKLVAVDDGARIRFSGLSVLTRLSCLTSLSVHAHERAINKNVRKAIASMNQLRNLTLLTSPDYPSAFARNLACLTQLTNLAVLRVGLGFGALDALRRLGAHVSKSLPHCTYQMLTDGCD